jgi:tRNA (mo5U34)-methyltransferase
MNGQPTHQAQLLAQRVAEISWWHTIDLGHGLVTPGKDKSHEKLATLHLPTDLTGKTVLDVGAWDGYFSFEAERRGASRVLATDSYSWGGQGWGSKAGFELAREALGSSVQDLEIDALELSPTTVGEWDIVLYLGVLYHMRDPLMALERIASVTRELVIVETLIDMTTRRRPAAAFYPSAEMDADQSNWWGPNEPAVVGMLRATGFDRIEVVDRRSQIGRVGRFVHNAANVAHSRLSRRRLALPWRYVETDRLVLHAWKRGVSPWGTQ